MELFVTSPKRFSLSEGIQKCHARFYLEVYLMLLCIVLLRDEKQQQYFIGNIQFQLR